ncbi:MAG: hypothetical protein KDB27_28355 [Planctomycetales bacterium]|nr:hypothetical protein [Planctomycetales bacterium]
MDIDLSKTMATSLSFLEEAKIGTSSLSVPRGLRFRFVVVRGILIPPELELRMPNLMAGVKQYSDIKITDTNTNSLSDVLREQCAFLCY